ncbi:hypothetical protein Slala05_77930 [Streptomyces lavendulae subsp. lavendulae]|nr:hypothetical protein Slala05_77930 [Streptomyces lavendulae subsp. lavendulae]
MLIVTREGGRRCKLPPHQRAPVALVYPSRHDSLARIATGFGTRIPACAIRVRPEAFCLSSPDMGRAS